MLVRTYSRRAHHLTPTFSAPSTTSTSDAVSDDPSLFISQDTDPYSLTLFSSQDSCPWSLEPDADLKPSKKSRNWKRAAPAPTSTLMEAQEFGEMMESVDEVEFALDGLRVGKPARVQKASLIALLSVCGSSRQRSLLRAQGMTKRIIDAILELNFEDPSSTTAAAALFFAVSSDVQDDYLLDSPPSIRFLLKLLNPPTSGCVEDRTPNIGSKFLGLRRPQVLNVIKKGMDSSSKTIFSKVQEILVSCKVIKRCTEEDEGINRPELNSKWISLLTMEKGCLSTVSFEDTSEQVRKVGGNFKETLRVLGGLDAVFDVIVSCRSSIESWLKHKPPSVRELKDGAILQSVVLLLKCLEIIENATFLSKDNQDHLLCMRRKLYSEGLPMSFVEVIISSIEILSGFSLLQSSSSVSTKRKKTCFSENVGADYVSQTQLNENRRDNKGRCGRTENSHVKRTKAGHKRRKLSVSSSELSLPSAKMSISVASDCYSVKIRSDCHASDLRNGALRSSNGDYKMKANGLNLNVISNVLKDRINANGSKVNSDKGASGRTSKRSIASDTSRKTSKRLHTPEVNESESTMNCSDPFAFNEDELQPSKPSKRENLPRKSEISLTLQSRVTDKEHSKEDIFNTEIGPINSQSTNGGSCHSCEDNRLLKIEDSNLLDDCLLASVKVLMNLTNDNPVGCQQIANGGALNTMVSLIINHFPSYYLCSPMHSKLKDDKSSSSQSTSAGLLNSKHLTDHGSEFLVAILGLLVNLVEKDDRNSYRDSSRLASTRVLMEISGVSEVKEKKRNVIPLLCTIFLANQGAGEAAEEGNLLVCDDEALTQGEKDAEMTILEAYSALLLAILSTESADVRGAIAGCLPSQNLEALVPVLERFVAFHLTLNMISAETHSIVTKAIESCKGC